MTQNSSAGLGKLESRIKWWKSTIKELESIEESAGLTTDEQRNRRGAECKLNEAMADEANFRSYRDGKFWHGEGEKCTSLFHKVVNVRLARADNQGMIIDGALVQDPIVCHNHIIDFYKELYTESEVNILRVCLETL